MADIKKQQTKMHGDKLSEAIKAEHADAVPGEDTAHAHSHAAHLGTEGNVRTSPESYGKQGREPGTLKEPPQDPRGSGKTHNRQ